MVDSRIPTLHLYNSYKNVTTVPAQIFSANTGAPLVSKTVKDGFIGAELNWGWVGKKESKWDKNELFLYSSVK